MSGFFITFEGPDGCGKSTQAQALANYLEQVGYAVVLTREPGGTAVGSAIRKMVLSSSVKLSKAAELMLFQADRAQHYKEVLKPALRSGKVVICDRYVDSTMAYQGAGRGWKRSDLEQLHRLTTGMLLPDLTFILRGRSHKTLSTQDTFEQEKEDFRSRLVAEYDWLSRRASRYVKIDANRSFSDVSRDVISAVERRLRMSLR